MWNLLCKSAMEVLTEPNNKTLCPVRIIGLVATVQGLALAAYQAIVIKTPFDLQAYGIGVGILLTSLGAALALKKDTPNDPK